ncbi:MAG: GNAT family N-acetyltransferase [Chlamydiia bacterium]|nr:GNAT family N-acetyltransferase [Chlamydiia bacterium]
MSEEAMRGVPLTFRFAQEADQQYIVSWLLQPGVLRWFPLADVREVEDAARICVSYAKDHAVLIALWDSVPCGVANLYLQGWKKLAHQSLFMIIVDEQYRNKGVGGRLLEELISLAKERFSMEMLHLEVYQGNPAINLYRRMGFEEYGVQKRFIKEADGIYLNKILMQKIL